MHDTGEWHSASQMTFWGQIDYPWIELRWDEPKAVNRVILYDRPDPKSHTAGGTLHFSDGSNIAVHQIPNNGAPKEIIFPTKRIEWLRFEVTDADGTNVGLSEIEIFTAEESIEDYVGKVDPFIESARGRYFFFVTGSQPFGMISAAPLTRNKNQYGGGYNYNSTEILGFPQIHDWMLSGITLMPVTGIVAVEKGENEWKSEFSHSGEIAQPGYGLIVYNKARQPIEAGGNIFCNGAQPYKTEVGSVTNSAFNPAIRLEEKGTEVWIYFRSDGFNSEIPATKLVTTAMLGKTKLVEANFENPDGSSLTIDKDYFGNKRPVNTSFPGPFGTINSDDTQMLVWK